jgi:hypothetical protein
MTVLPGAANVVETRKPARATSGKRFIYIIE